MKFSRYLTIDITYFAQSITLTCSKEREREREREREEDSLTVWLIVASDFATITYDAQASLKHFAIASLSVCAYSDLI